MALLTLVKSLDNDTLLLQSSEPSSNADFSLFDIDGEGSGNPFGMANEWEVVEGIESQEYDEDDTDSFWDAQQEILKQCIQKGIHLPEYAEVWQ